MKKTIYLLFIVLLCNARLSAQVCTVIDSFNINLPGLDDAQMQTTSAIAYNNGYLWIASTSDSQRTYFAYYVNIYKYDLTGNRVDSIPYIMGTGDVYVAFAADDTALWALKAQTDTIYEYNIASKSIMNTYSMGGRGLEDLGYTMASIGDTLYFIGENTGTSFKFSKSADVFADYPTYAGITGVYPSGMCGIGSSLVATTYLDLAPVSFDDVSIINPGPFTENVSDRQDWCIDIPDALTYGGGYFWQIKTSFITFDIRQCYVYQVQSSLSSLATSVKNIANGTDFVISPNPAYETINITYQETNGWNSFSVSLYSITGSKIFTQLITGGNGETSIDISQLNLSSGMYFIELSNGAEQIMKKVCVQ